MAAPLSIPCLCSVAALLAGLGWGETMAQAAQEDTTQLVVRPKANQELAKSIDAAVRRREAPSDVWPQARRIFFPPDPPPLGAQINIDPHRKLSPGVPHEFGAHVTEAFYAPLSTCLTDLSVHSQRKFRPRIDAYTKARDRLLVELRAVLAAHAGASREVRAAEFLALAQRQAKALEALEAEAEVLRAALADKVSWYDFRAWKLDAGALHPRRPEHRVLEFQLVRAAAFYQPGLLPAQRRLLREAAMLMQDEMFADESAGTVSAPAAAPRLVFFSPDLVRLLPMAEMPPAIVARLDAWVAEKDALRQELTAAVIAEDKAKFPASRRRVLEKLARARAARLDALDAQAEEIRREYAPNFDRRRLPRPDALPADVAAVIDRFLADRSALFAVLEVRIQVAGEGVVAGYRGHDLMELRDLQMQEMRSVIDAFSQEHLTELTALEAELERVHRALVACVGEAALVSEGGTPDSFLAEFMARYRQSWAYYEYEIAVFEPALSPAQRRLLLGGAIRRLELPLPRAERQPVVPPLTILNEELKRPGARLR